MRAHALALAALATASPLRDERRSWPTIDLFLSKILSYFPASLAVSAACGLISAGDAAASDILGIADSADDGCGDVQLVFVRGTCEPGNVGVLVGPWVARSLQAAMGGGKLAVQGLGYPASVDDYLRGSAANGVLLASKIKSTLAACPRSKMVLAGYSQGAMVVHNAVGGLDEASVGRIEAVVLFGDPYSQQPVAGIDPARVRIYCNAGDNICDDGPIITTHHLTYALDADDAAAFVAGWI